MQQLEKYCMDVRCIHGVDTYIISPAHYEDLLRDTELMERLQLSRVMKEQLEIIVEICKRVSVLYPAFGWHKAWVERFQWEPIYCYQRENIFYHVMYRESWMCRECGYILRRPLIMPKVEQDAVFYSGTENRWPDIPPIFQKVNCPKCGRMLQNHLILL